MLVLSLGHACQVAHQLHRLFGKQETFFFDWIVTDHAALIRNAGLDAGGLLIPKNLERAPNRKSVLDKGTGLRFYGHDFTAPDGLIPDDFMQSVDQVRDKYRRRANRTHELLASGMPVVMVRQEPDGVREDEIIAEFAGQYPRGRFRYVWCTDAGSYGTMRTPLGGNWKGDDEAWDRVASAIVQPSEALHAS